MKTLLFYVFTFILVCLIYGKTIHYQYNLDDKLATSIYPSVKKGIKGIPEILSSPYLDKYQARYGGFRPLTRVTYAIEYQFFGENTTVNHLINILIYCLCCIFFFHLIKTIFPKWEWWIFVISAIIFVCHPLHVEVVSSLKNREVLLSFLFGISSILMISKERSLIRIILSVILFLLAAFSKLDAVFFPVFAAFLFYMKNEWSAWKSMVFGTLLPISAVAIYLFAHHLFPEPIKLELLEIENPIVGHEFTLNHFATIAYILAYNWKLMLIPNQFLFIYGTGPFSLMNWGNVIVIFSALIHVLSLILMVNGIIKKRTYSLIIIFYFFSIGLYMNLVQIIPGVTGDRLLFTTTCVLSLIFGFSVNAFSHLTKRKSLLKISSISVALVLCVYMSIKGYNRVDCWENPIVLGNCDIDQLENSALAQVVYLRFLDTELKKQKSDYDKKYLINKSIEHGYKTLELNPNSYHARVHLGYVFCYELDSVKLGGELLYQAMQKGPNDPLVLYNLGLCFEKKGEIDNAAKFYKAALGLKADNVTLKSKLVMSYCISNDLQSAKKEIDDLVENFAYDHKSFISEGVYYLFSQDTLRATQSFEKALLLKPELIDLKKQIVDYYKSKGNMEKIKFYE